MSQFNQNGCSDLADIEAMLVNAKEVIKKHQDDWSPYDTFCVFIYIEHRSKEWLAKKLITGTAFYNTPNGWVRVPAVSPTDAESIISYCTVKFILKNEGTKFDPSKGSFNRWFKYEVFPKAKRYAEYIGEQVSTEDEVGSCDTGAPLLVGDTLSSGSFVRTVNTKGNTNGYEWKNKDPISDIETAEMKEIVGDLISKRNETHRAVLERLYFWGDSPEEIANDLGITRENVDVIKYRFVKMAKEAIKGSLRGGTGEI